MKLKQEPYASTMMSSIKTAYKHYYNKEISNSMLYGLSGHAFVTAISRTCGPCASYTWNMDEFTDLCSKNFGVSVLNEEHPVNSKSTQEEKQKASDLIKSYLDDGYLVLLVSYEYQVITGYNDTHFTVTIPWDAPSVTYDIALNTLEGIKDFALFSKMEKSETIPLQEGITNSIQFALNQYEDIKTLDFIVQGINAFDYWLEQMTEKTFNGHGMWWTSNVWAECRLHASNYMRELKEYFKDNDTLEQLSKMYQKSSDLFMELSVKDGIFETKVKKVKELKENEINIKDLLLKLI